ncbi:MAG: valine--tRNA ligase [Candidatus Wallbacteria bacterium]|nr:valine--tRNA ligase [Candidatus Wallbacteria bacterium]
MKTTEIPSKYQPEELEKKWYAFWMEGGYFKSRASADKKPFTIVIPPPNVTGILHMGHAFNNTLQDLIIRTRRMQGFEACWLPGTDHAGIATQNVVEKALAKEGKKREDLGRDAFIKRVWEWKKEHGGTIINQLKKLGCSCDWDRERFTMDEGLSRAVREAFCRLYEEGLIYRGYYLVNWCPRCTTAIADDEVEHEEINGAFYHVKYFFKDQPDKFIVIATTRPETMLGDTGVAVNPDDERYKDLIGRKLILPLVGRELPIIADKRVDLAFGTGALKVTPAHDINDYEIGQEHKLEFVSVMDEKARMNHKAGKYAGLDRYECRKRIVEDLTEQGFLIQTVPHLHSVGHCYRCHTAIEPRYSEQWFVKMKPLSVEALAVVNDGLVKFHPETWAKTYENWLNGIRDWCISRQIWWGHRIPVFYCDECKHTWASRVDDKKCPKCGTAEIHQDPDVLDTWFSSSLWPFSTFGWPDNTADLNYFYPTSTLSTGFDIIFFWVARMIMMGTKFMKDVPFRDVYIHALLRDEHGKKMSKSSGNAIDPVKLIEDYGTDALRFTMASLAIQGRDVNVSLKKIEGFRNFMNKLWNAHRYILMNLEGYREIELKKEELLLPDRWILSRLENTVATAEADFNSFRFSHSSQSLYEFLWDDFCDWYIEISKVSLASSDKQRKLVTQNVLYRVLARIITLLHPYTPFITEEIRENMGIAKPLIISEYPQVDQKYLDLEAEQRMAVVKEIVRASRNFRSEYQIPPQQLIRIMVKPENERILTLITDSRDYIISLTKCSTLETGLQIDRQGACGTQVVAGAVLYFPLEGLIDTNKEVTRLTRERELLLTELGRVDKKLNSDGFLAKAKPEVVTEQREKREELGKKLAQLEQNLTVLKK